MRGLGQSPRISLSFHPGYVRSHGHRNATAPACRRATRPGGGDTVWVQSNAVGTRGTTWLHRVQEFWWSTTFRKIERYYCGCSICASTTECRELVSCAW